MPDPLLDLPLDQIDAGALPRDRTHLDDTALEELMTSIAATTLRQPIEVWALSTPRPPHHYGLISGHRRLTAFRTLHQRWQLPRFATIPAFIRTPADVPAVLTAMVEENDIRADISPWERGLICITTRDQGYFPTLDAAVEALYPSASRQKRARLRACAAVVEELGGLFTAPERLKQTQIVRLAGALHGGFDDLITHILQDCAGQTLQSQWSALLPTLTEAERRDPETPATATTPARPRRLLKLHQGLILRRELSPTGWLLRFSGPEAKRGGLMDDVMDMVERLFQRG